MQVYLSQGRRFTYCIRVLMLAIASQSFLSVIYILQPVVLGNTLMLPMVRR